MPFTKDELYLISLIDFCHEMTGSSGWRDVVCLDFRKVLDMFSHSVIRTKLMRYRLLEWVMGWWDMDWTLGLRCGPQSHRVELETSYLCTPFRGWYWGQQKAYQDCQGMEHGTSEEKLGKLHLFSFSGETALGVSCCSLQLNWAGCVGKMEPGFLQGYTVGEGWEATKLKDGSLKSELWKKIRCYEGVQTLAQVPQRGGIVILGDTQNLCEEWPEQPVLAQITLSRTLV